MGLERAKRKSWTLPDGRDRSAVTILRPGSNSPAADTGRNQQALTVLTSS
jgi:hypothetical protein